MNPTELRTLPHGRERSPINIRFAMARRAIRMTAKEVGERTGICQTLIRRLEASPVKRPSAYVVLALADCYGVTVSWLMKGEPGPCVEKDHATMRQFLQLPAEHKQAVSALIRGFTV